MDDKAQIMFACYIKEIKTQEKNPSHSWLRQYSEFC
jgi:hypothetical protein